MYKNNGADRGYEDAIPVKRSRRSERARSELRRESAMLRNGVDFSISKNIPKTEAGNTVKKKTEPVKDRTVPINRPVVRPVDVPERTDTNNATSPVSVSGSENTVRTVKKITAPQKVSESVPAVHDVQKTVPVKFSPIPAAFAPSVTDRSDSPEEKSDNIQKPAQPVPVKHTVVKRVSDDGEYVSVAGFRTISRATVAAESVKKRKITVGMVIRRTLLSLFTVIVLLVGTLFGGLAIAANGPSPTIRDFLVLSALQASATKWVPGIFLDDEVVDQILKDSQKVNKDIISVDDYTEQQDDGNAEDKWANAIDGMIYESVSGPTFKGYVLLVRDPSRISVGVATDHFTDTNEGMRIFEMADKYGAVAAINGGEYPDAGGMGIGGRPIGITYSDGKCVWSDGLRRSFMGFDKNDRLIVREGLTKAQAEELGIRDGVCFQTGKTLITNENGNVTMYYADNNTGTAQRTAIGQTADGTVILLVTDGRTASSLGATHNDVIDIMVSYGAISAGMLDGGSSSLMYYRDFYDKYGLDKSDLDEYQRKGLINKYKAFTNPRRIPTCFIVAPE